MKNDGVAPLLFTLSPGPKTTNHGLIPKRDLAPVDRTSQIAETMRPAVRTWGAMTLRLLAVAILVVVSVPAFSCPQEVVTYPELTLRVIRENRAGRG
jgi:hypothetical protein